MYISSRLTDSEYAAGKALDAVCGRPNAHFDDSLHLAVSMRSFRAENVSAFVKALLDCEEQQARETFANLANRYPIVLTRNLDSARRWVRDAGPRHGAIRAGGILEGATAEAACHRHPRRCGSGALVSQ